MSPFLLVLLCLVVGILAYRRQLRFLHIFQQEEYDNERFLNWFKKERAFDLLASLALLVAQFSASSALYALALVGIGFIAYTEPNPTQQARKTLNLTERAQRLLQLALFLSLLLGAIIILINRDYTALGMLATLQVLPFALVIANNIFKSHQEKLNQGFLDEAKQKLAIVHPNVIGITGSFGKTSTKHILHHILSSQIPTLTTPGSVNTPLGIARIIREQLTNSHQYFVAEMGAYGPGSIARLCELTPPTHSAITALGEAHYERFKNLETVAQAKFEIAQSSLSRGGKVVLQVDSMRNIHYAQEFIKQHRENLILVGCESSKETVDFYIESPIQDKQGIHFTLIDTKKEISYSVHAPIYGLAQCSNVAIAIILATLAGISFNTAIAAVASTLQIPHRMQVLTLPNGTTLIDNAYNSNPVGFASSLDLLMTLAGNEKRRVLITPGLVELGAQHHAIHRELGVLAAKYVDILLLVNPKRVPTFYQGFTEATFGRLQRLCIPVDTLKDAQKWLDTKGTDKDVILIENDLPDVYFKWQHR
ncbi:MAG: UDP-N-acetylmuramoyl-tripeptide--D-alanyl-D-alanine ligase [Pseudomonadota bacterium]